MASQQVTILGGTGVVGSRIARALAAEGTLRVRLAGRRAAAGQALAAELKASFQPFDLAESASIASAVAGSALVIHAAGPFQGQDQRVAEAALQAGAHYLDLSDAREHCLALRALDARARERQLCLLSGAALSTALTHALVAHLQPAFAALNEIHLGLVLGGAAPLGPAWNQGLEAQRGRPLKMKLGGEWTERRGLGDERWLELPAPTGRRRGYNFDWSELELFPETWRSGMVRVSGTLPAKTGLLGRWLGGRAASGSAAVGVWMRGTDNKRLPMERRLALISGADGLEFALLPLLLLARRLLGGELIRAGAGPAINTLEWSQLEGQLVANGVRILRGDLGGWK